MKKNISFLVMMLLFVFPVLVNADSTVSIDLSCGELSSDNTKTCVVTYKISGDGIYDELGPVTLTELGGAEVTEVTEVLGSDWSIVSQNETQNGKTVTLSSVGMGAGDGDLFKFTYKASGQEDCEIKIKLGQKEVSVKPEAPETPETPENPQTGITMPYIALGVVAALAIGSYLVTRNKTKMYKI